MKNIVEIIDYKDHVIKIISDHECDSPDDWGDNDYFLVYDHRNFTITRKGFDPQDIFDAMQKRAKLYDDYFYFPVYAYIHSGISLQLQRWFPGLPQGHNEFDVSFKGFALVKRQKGSYIRDKAYEIAKSVVEEWNDYLSGNVYGYIVEKDDEHIDSCWGFYGDYEKSGIIEEAKNVVDWQVKKALQAHITRLKTYIRNHVPLEVRAECEVYC